MITFQSINDDCLREIFTYLNILEIVELSSTCTRLQNFTEDCIFTKLANQIKIKFCGFHTCIYVTTIELNNLEKVFEVLGSFVNQLFLIQNERSTEAYTSRFKPKSWRTIENILNLCPNLHTLCMKDFIFGHSDPLLQHVLPSLKVFRLENCSGIRSDWSEILKRSPLIEHITITGQNEITGDFFMHCSLSSLAIDYRSLSTKSILHEDLFNHIGQSIQKLKIIDFTNAPRYKPIRTIIVENLPKLENLEVEDKLSVKLTMSLTQLPHLTSLKVNCWLCSVKALLRKLSDQGTIEVLHIYDGWYDVDDDEDENMLPLVFNRLQSVTWELPFAEDSSDVFMALTEFQTPMITCFNFDDIEVEAMGSLLALIESKETLTSISLDLFMLNNVERNTLALGIIDIIKRKNRPFFTLNIIELDIEADLVIKIMSGIYILYFYNFLYIFGLQMTALKKNRHQIALNANTKPQEAFRIEVPDCYYRDIETKLHSFPTKFFEDDFSDSSY